METIQFEEIQRFGKKWMWLIFALPLALIAGAFLLVLLRDTKDMESAFIALGSGFFFVLIFLLGFLYTRLTTRISDQGVSVRLSPFNRKFRIIPFSEIDKIFVRQFSPLGEYGGWGLRFTIGERAYIVSGKTGIQIVLKNGKKVLISTQKAEEAASVIQHIEL